MLNTIIQKNETFSKYYILDDFLLFKIKSIKTTKEEQFVFFDYTYKITNFTLSFHSMKQNKNFLKDLKIIKQNLILIYNEMNLIDKLTLFM